MASSLTKLLPPTVASSSQAGRLLKPSTLPVPLLSTPLAKNYSYVHTALVLLYYYVRSSTLVADPLPTLIQDAVLVALLQCSFCAICVPQAGNWISGTNAGKIIEGTASMGKSARTSGPSGTGSVRRKIGASGAGASKGSKSGGDNMSTGGSWQSRILPTILSLILSLAVPPLPLMILALLLGAPLYPTSSLPYTLALSAHVSLLSMLPLFYIHGVSASAWRDVSAAWLPFDEAGVWGATVGTMVGGWVGAVPMALDWDREWQKWPCTVLWGAVLGWAVGRLVTGPLKLGVGRRINLSEKEYVPSMNISDASVTGEKKEA